MKKTMSLLIASVCIFPVAAQAPRPIVRPIPAQQVIVQEQEEPEVRVLEEVKETPKDINIGLSETSCVEIAGLLNKLLSDEYILYVKTQNYHWNIKNSMNFNDLHLFFGKQYENLAGIVDEVAERVRSLGVRAMGTMNEFIKNSQLKEQDNLVPTDKEMIQNLLDDHEAIIRSLRPVIAKTAELQDMGTNNFLSGLVEKHEKMSWMLRSYLK